MAGKQRDTSHECEHVLPTASERMRPAEVPKERLAAVLGLISDTHIPDRCPFLPPSALTVFEGVNLILHAGDVGDLRVLDELSSAAPVVAVHGNDEAVPGAQELLPLQQIISVNRHRICLTHGHDPDRQREKDDRWAGKHARLARQAIAAGAQILLYGHTHVPGVALSQGVWLINAGALASGSYATRQRAQTVALIYLRDDGKPYTIHVDLARPDVPQVLTTDWKRGYRATAGEAEEPIYSPAARFLWQQAWEWGGRDPDRLYSRLRDLFRVLSYRCWSGEQERIDSSDVMERLDSFEPASERESLRAALHAAMSTYSLSEPLAGR